MKNRYAVGILLIAMFLIFLAFEKPDDGAQISLQKVDAHSDLVETKVNDHLGMTAKKIELQQELAEAQLKRIPKVGDRLGPDNSALSAKSRGVDFSEEMNESTVYEDLNRHPKEYSKWKGPGYRVQNEETLKEDNVYTTQAEMAEYARQFIENARRGGYRVQLNEDYVVISVQKLPENHSLDLRQPSGSGAK